MVIRAISLLLPRGGIMTPLGMNGIRVAPLSLIQRRVKLESSKGEIAMHVVMIQECETGAQVPKDKSRMGFTEPVYETCWKNDEKT